MSLGLRGQHLRACEPAAGEGLVASTTQVSMGAKLLRCPALGGRQSVPLSKLMPIQDSLLACLGPFSKNCFDQFSRRHTVTATILIKLVIRWMAQFDFGARHLDEYEFI